uniref:Protein eva-1 homolog C (inferred by orthology to a human protein) n=1 Tax=Strongyloides venezuelensis TaxID=75913 RepID=A0A0K0F9G2_STRVS
MAFYNGQIVYIIPLLVFSLALFLEGDIKVKSYVSQKTIDALMFESLKNNQVLACENEKVTLSCPKNTHIIITHSFFGRLIPSTELCPAPKNYIIGKEDTTCDIPESDMKLKELCEGKRKCRITVKSSFVDRDPCPETSKYLQMSYKCKPISFEDQHFCDGTQLQLTCKTNKRLSIYSATWGINMNGIGATKCASKFRTNNSGKTDVANDCLIDVLPQVLKECHAKSNCAMAVNDYFLGSPCKNNGEKSLSIIYMCINDEVFSDAALKGQLDTMDVMKKEFKEKQEEDKMTSQEDDEEDEDYDHYDDSNSNQVNINKKTPRNGFDIDEKEINKEIIFQRDEPHVEEKVYHHIDSDDYKISKQSFNEPTTMTPNAIDIAKEFYALIDFVKNNQEKCILYFGISIAVGIIVLLLIFIAQYTRNSHKISKEKMSSSKVIKPNHGEMSLLIGSSSGTSPLYFNPSEPDMYGGSGSNSSFQYTDMERIYSSPSYRVAENRIISNNRYDSSIPPPPPKLSGRYNYC